MFELTIAARKVGVLFESRVTEDRRSRVTGGREIRRNDDERSSWGEEFETSVRRSSRADSWSRLSRWESL